MTRNRKPGAGSWERETTTADRLLRASLSVAAALVAIPLPLAAAQRALPVTLATRAERTAFSETSSYSDVMHFVRAVDAAAPHIRLTTFGYTVEGRALPLLVVGNVPNGSARAVRESGKLRVFVQANIHAGEVCGKEALQILLRDLANGLHAEWLDSLVILVAPIYNADGNERVSLTNRGRQHGPLGGMGQRANAQDLDLNRDHMKVESPEARSLLALMREYDPHALVDLHTTNGTRHGYHLTYAPPLHPNTHPAIDDLLRRDWLPAVTSAFKEKTGWDMYYYGNAPPANASRERGWYTFDHRPRFNNNYAGLRNRVAILSEAYAYAPFEERVFASLRFVEEILEYAFTHATAVRRAVTEAESGNVSGQELTLRATWQRADSVEILLGDVVEERNPFSGRPILRRLDVQRVERMPEFGTFQPVETTQAPAAYVVPAGLRTVLDNLDDHGIAWHRADSAMTVSLERFVIDSTTASARAFQGHRERTLFGSYVVERADLPPGTVLVPVNQPLGRLVFTLLEPRSDDGLANWNVLDEEIERLGTYPILRIPAGGR